MHFADIMRCVAFCIIIIINGFLMTERQMTYKDMCEYILVENVIKLCANKLCCCVDEVVQVCNCNYIAEVSVVVGLRCCSVCSTCEYR